MHKHSLLVSGATSTCMYKSFVHYYFYSLPLEAPLHCLIEPKPFGWAQESQTWGQNFDLERHCGGVGVVPENVDEVQIWEKGHWRNGIARQGKHCSWGMPDETIVPYKKTRHKTFKWCIDTADFLFWCKNFKSQTRMKNKTKRQAHWHSCKGEVTVGMKGEQWLILC